MLRILFCSMFVGLFVVACGGAKIGDASSDSSMEPIDELQALATELETEMNNTLKPINEADAVIEKIAALPGKLNVDSASMMSMASMTVNGNQVEISVDFTADAEIKAEIEGALNELKAVVDGLKAMPDATVELTKKATTAAAKLPVLATKVTTKAQAKIANPLASADIKAKAQLQIDSVSSIQAVVEGKITEIQNKATELPTMATEVMTKLTASFAAATSTEG